MIKTFYKEDIIIRLGAIFTYGFNNKYSLKAIEEYLVKSSFINDLENNEFNYSLSNEKVIEDIYMVKVDEVSDISIKSMFIAESYINLFLYFNKSFEYLFLYLPLSTFIDKYNIYHEMDFSNLKDDFKSLIKETPLFRKICIFRNIKYNQISKLTGININTIVKYSRDDKYLYRASFEIIYKLSSLLKVKDNIFLSSLGVYFDQSIYLLDESNSMLLNYLGLYYADYFDKRINMSNFIYSKDEDYFLSIKDDIKLIVIGSNILDINSSSINNRKIDSKSYIVIFPVDFSIINKKKLEYLKQVKCLDVMIISQKDAIIVKKHKRKEITNTIYNSFNRRAKESSL